MTTICSFVNLSNEQPPFALKTDKLFTSLSDYLKLTLFSGNERYRDVITYSAYNLMGVANVDDKGNL